MVESEKRKAPDEISGQRNHKKSKSQYNNEKAKARATGQSVSIEPGDAGIFATCSRGQEAKCVRELKDLFEEHAEKIYQSDRDPDVPAGVEEEHEVDIESEIRSEVKNLKKPGKEPLFKNVRLDVLCVLFFKTREPVEPVSFVRAICQDILESGVSKTRFAMRLTPISIVNHASEKGLENAASTALAPHFHLPDIPPRKFAIRANIRNHNKILSQTKVIETVAPLVDSRHSVDLKDYDLLILVEVYTNICGVSVVGNDYEKLRRFNLTEIQGEVLKKPAAPNESQPQDLIVKI